MEVTYDINSTFWRSVYRKLFSKNGFHMPNMLSRSDLERILREQDGIEIVRDIDGRWVAVKIASQDEAVRLMLAYGE